MFFYIFLYSVRIHFYIMIRKKLLIEFEFWQLKVMAYISCCYWSRPKGNSNLQSNSISYGQWRQRR